MFFPWPRGPQVLGIFVPRPCGPEVLGLFFPRPCGPQVWGICFSPALLAGSFVQFLFPGPAGRKLGAYLFPPGPAGRQFLAYFSTGPAGQKFWVYFSSGSAGRKFWDVFPPALRGMCMLDAICYVVVFCCCVFVCSPLASKYCDRCFFNGRPCLCPGVRAFMVYPDVFELPARVLIVRLCLGLCLLRLLRA